MSLFGNLFGGGHGGGGAKFNNVVDALKSDLNLSETQGQQVLQALMNFRSERKEVKAAGGDKSQLKGAKDDLKEKILGVLNDEQKQKFIANAAKYDELMHPNK